LLSGGLDSVAALTIAKEQMDVELALVFDYGQRSAKREIEYSKKVSEHFGIEHRVIELAWLASVTKTSLVNTDVDVPEMSMEKIADEADSSITIDSAKSVWVPNRNGVLINIAASFAESMGLEYVIVGFNKEEGATFPDNTPEFMTAIDDSLSYSTMNGVKVLAPLINMGKKEIVSSAVDLNAPLEFSWSCYHGAAIPCGICESCMRRKRAFAAINVADPLLVRLNALSE
jgi:7-cyano-7-deazaguanine synthase